MWNAETELLIEHSNSLEKNLQSLIKTINMMHQCMKAFLETQFEAVYHCNISSSLQPELKGKRNVKLSRRNVFNDDRNDLYSRVSSGNFWLPIVSN